MKTYTLRARDIGHDWHVVDAEGIPLGRLASRVAQLLRGKHKPSFTPHMDCGDVVVVINASKVRLTGRKAEQKTQFRYSGYMGKEKHLNVGKMLKTRPQRVVEHAVFGMLPKTTLGRQQIRKKLKVYAGAEHPHQAQQPTPLAAGKDG